MLDPFWANTVTVHDSGLVAVSLPKEYCEISGMFICLYACMCTYICSYVSTFLDIGFRIHEYRYVTYICMYIYTYLRFRSVETRTGCDVPGVSIVFLHHASRTVYMIMRRNMCEL